MNFCTKKNVGILTYADEAFPASLYEIKNPPVLLYYRGVLPDFNKICMISMVGTRRLTDYGRKNAFIIGHDLAAILCQGTDDQIQNAEYAFDFALAFAFLAFFGVVCCYFHWGFLF